MKKALGLGCVIGVFCCPIFAQAPAASSSNSGAVLRSSTRLVEVNVIAQGKGGKPVKGLLPEDFTITDNGKPQKIAVFSENSAAPLPSPATPLPPGTFTNRIEQKPGAPSSTTVILLDALNTELTDQAYAKAQVLEFLKKLRPEDHVGIYALGRSLVVLHDFTADPSQLVQKVAAYSGEKFAEMTMAPPAGYVQPDPQDDSGGGAEDPLQRFLAVLLRFDGAFQDLETIKRTEVTLSALESIAAHLAGVPGRKNLVWVSGAFPLSIGYDGSYTWRAPMGNLALDPMRTRRTYGDEVDRTVRAMQNANLAIYPVDARGFMTDSRTSAAQRTANTRPDPLLPKTGLANQGAMWELAARTGGIAYVNTNDLTMAVREAVADSEISYTLAYYPADRKYDGKSRQIKVRAKSPDLKLRYRQSYVDLPEEAPDEESRQARLSDAVSSALDAAGVGVTLQIQASKAGGSGLDLAIRVEPSSISLRQQDGRWNGKLQVVLAQLDRDGRQRDAVTDTLDLSLQEATYQRIVREGLTHRRTIEPSPGATRLRVVVQDGALGAVGSVTVAFRDLQQ